MPEAPDPRAYRDAIGRFATGVTVVTCDSPEGPTGLTTNAIASLSLDPLLLLVCFDNTSRTLPYVQAAGRFAVNVLGDDQAGLASVFASKAAPHEKFADVIHRVEHGLPVLDGALAWFACDVHSFLPGGDHTIGLGRVTAVHHEDEGSPLLWFGGGYRSLGS